MNKRIFGLIFIVIFVLGAVIVVSATNQPTPKVAGIKTHEKTVHTSNDKDSASDAKIASETSYFTSDLVDCLAPDGKTSKSSKADCDNLLSFWRNHPAAPNAGSNGSSSNSSSSNVVAVAIVEASTVTPTPTPIPSVTPTVTPTPTPIPSVTPTATPTPTVIPTATPTPTILPKMEIKSVKKAECDSSSCAGWLTTLIVSGKNFTADSRVVLSHQGVIVSSNYVGGNFSTKIITDFYYIPDHMTFDVTVTDPKRASVTLHNGFSADHDSDDHGHDR